MKGKYITYKKSGLVQRTNFKPLAILRAKINKGMVDEDMGKFIKSIRDYRKYK